MALRWVGLSSDDIELFIREDSEESWKRHLDAVISAIEERLNDPFEEPQNIELKNIIKPHLIVLKGLGAQLSDNDYKNFTKTTKCLSANRFNRIINEILQLPYQMTMKKQSQRNKTPKKYSITKKSG